LSIILTVRSQFEIVPEHFFDRLHILIMKDLISTHESIGIKTIKGRSSNQVFPLKSFTSSTSNSSEEIVFTQKPLPGFISAHKGTSGGVVPQELI